MSATAVPATGAGERMYDLATRLFPMCRSITGAGVRDTLQEVARLIPLERDGGAERHTGPRLDDPR